jgi:hypothetical protein
LNGFYWVPSSLLALTSENPIRWLATLLSVLVALISLFLYILSSLESTVERLRAYLELGQFVGLLYVVSLNGLPYSG